MVRADGTHITGVDASFAVTGVQEPAPEVVEAVAWVGNSDGPQTPPGSRASPGAEPVGESGARPARPARPTPPVRPRAPPRRPPDGPIPTRRTLGVSGLPKTSRAADERFIVMKWMPGAPSSRRRRDDSEAIAIPRRAPPRRPRAGRAGR